MSFPLYVGVEWFSGRETCITVFWKKRIVHLGPCRELPLTGPGSMVYFKKPRKEPMGTKNQTTRQPTDQSALNPSPLVSCIDTDCVIIISMEPWSCYGPLWNYALRNKSIVPFFDLWLNWMSHLALGQKMCRYFVAWLSVCPYRPIKFIHDASSLHNAYHTCQLISCNNCCYPRWRGDLNQGLLRCQYFIRRHIRISDLEVANWKCCNIKLIVTWGECELR